MSVQQADMISSKTYHIPLLCTQLSYASFHAAVMWIRGSRSPQHHPIYEHVLTLATVEGKIPSSIKQ